MAGIPPNLERDVLSQAGKGKTTREIAAWLAEKGVQVSHKTVAKLLARHREERADVAKVVVREELQKTLPSDLRRLEEIRADLQDEADGLKDKKTGKVPANERGSYLQLRRAELDTIRVKLHFSGADDEGPGDSKAKPGVLLLPPKKRAKP